jgi:multicomponent Na+:H+ antiporter subunit D
MPLTTVFCIIGSLSISGFPLFSGFVTKSMTLTAAAETHVVWVTIGLLVASAGVVDHSGIKIPFFAFFAQDSGKRVKEAPWNMLLAMAAMAAICIGIGLYPAPLYDLLPYPVDYAPYTASHVMTSLQLLLFAALAFLTMWKLHASKRRGPVELLKYPPELRGINLDTDWVYRRAFPWLGRWVGMPLVRAWVALRDGTYRMTAETVDAVGDLTSPKSKLGEPWSVGLSAWWAVLALGLCLFAAYGL